MDIKIGFTETPRELVIKLTEAREEALARIREAMSNEERVIELTDDKGRTYLVNAKEIAYVEVGSGEQRAVGFGGI